VIAARSPHAGIGGHEDRDGGDADGCGQVSDTRIVADVEAGCCEPAGQVVQIVDADGFVESVVKMLFGADAPFHGKRETCGGFAE
jgi:hypothetical protein